ncbi:MAG: hypothetical protein FWD48_05195 [Oscillospiraceae bacterium]|nr:hypothetical protein [Oscillospiraceae bacterium]
MKLVRILIIIIAVFLTAIPAGAAAIYVQKNEGDFLTALINTEELGLAAGQTYALTVEIEAGGTTGYRIRYTDANYNSFGDTDNDALNSAAAMAKGTEATQIPARFDSGTILNGNTGRIVIFFTHGVDLPDVVYDPSLYYIGVYGIQGGSDYTAAGVMVSDANGNVLEAYGTLEGEAAPAIPENLIGTAPPPTPEPEPDAPAPVDTPQQPEAEPQAPADTPQDNTGDVQQDNAQETSAPANTTAPQSTGKTSPLLVFLIIAVAVIFGGAVGGAIFLKKG